MPVRAPLVEAARCFFQIVESRSPRATSSSRLDGKGYRPHQLRVRPFDYETGVVTTLAGQP
jgi:hypothetical protein